MGSGLFFLCFFTVNQGLGQNFDFFDNIFAFKLDELRFISSILGTILFENVLKHLLDYALLFLDMAFLAFCLGWFCDNLHFQRCFRGRILSS